jgi:hypothetical protein
VEVGRCHGRARRGWRQGGGGMPAWGGAKEEVVGHKDDNKGILRYSLKYPGVESSLRHWWGGEQQEEEDDNMKYIYIYIYRERKRINKGRKRKRKKYIIDISSIISIYHKMLLYQIFLEKV